jgi:hypothetical protein
MGTMCSIVGSGVVTVASVVYQANPHMETRRKIQFFCLVRTCITCAMLWQMITWSLVCYRYSSVLFEFMENMQQHCRRNDDKKAREADFIHRGRFIFTVVGRLTVVCVCILILTIAWPWLAHKFPYIALLFCIGAQISMFVMMLHAVGLTRRPSMMQVMAIPIRRSIARLSVGSNMFAFKVKILTSVVVSTGVIHTAGVD